MQIFPPKPSMEPSTNVANLSELEDIYPLSPVQEGILFQSLLEEDAAVYFGQLTWELQGWLNLNAIRQAWQMIASRHAIFRTAFIWEGVDRPLQVVTRHVDVPIEIHDLQSLTLSDQNIWIKQYLETDRTRGFNLTAAPLMRIAVLQTSPTTHHFVWSQHHMLLDGWSALLTLKEVLHLYGAYSRGEDHPLPAPRPYRDYIAWLEQVDKSETEHYWRSALKGLRPTFLPAPSGYQHKKRKRGHIEFVLSSDLTEKAKRMVQNRHITLNTLIQGTWALLLSMYTGENDVVFGGTVSGRSAPVQGIEEIIGLFINIIPIRAYICDDAPLISWLKSFQHSQAEARSHEHASLSSLQQWTDIPGTLRLFDTLVSFQNLHISLDQDHAFRNQKEATGHPVSVVKLTTFENSEFPLSVTVGIGDQLVFAVTFNELQFPEAFIRRFMRGFELLLSEIVTNPTIRPRELSIVAEEEASQVLEASAGPRLQLPRLASVYNIFSQQATKCPDSTAVCTDSEFLSYSVLKRRAENLAAILSDQGLTTEHLVGVCLDRGLDLATAVLGTLATGAAYVPLEPSFPNGRLAHLVQDSGLECVLTSRRMKERFSKSSPLIFVEDLFCESYRSGFTPLNETFSEALIYVIYTSGTTGAPKGAMNTQAAVLNRLSWMQNEYQLTPKDKILQKSPISFDVSVWEFFWPLMFGGTLVMLPPDGHHDPRSIITAIQKHEITILHFTPSMLREVIDSPSISACHTLERVICSGEALDMHLAESFHSLLRAQLHNLYGSTEVAIDVTHCVASNKFDTLTMPIGKPISNTETYVLDKHMRQTPCGVPGELYIGGIGLGRGYRNRPDWTADRFIPSPFTRKPGVRLYRSGDIVKRLEDGNLEFVYRSDNQLYIKGNQVELGEIEAVLGELDNVKECAVVCRKEQDSVSLLAYIVGISQDKAPDLSLCRNALNKRLPQYMVPNQIILLDRFPISSNGKLDREALPVPDSLSTGTSISGPILLSPVEEIVAGVFAEVLGVEKLTPQDNFFDLGGHSLLAMKLVGRLRNAFSINLPVRAIYVSPTPLLLARHVQGLRSKTPPVPISRLRSHDGLPLSFAQERLWLFQQLNPRSSAYNIPVALALTGDLDSSALLYAFETIVERHEILRTVFAERLGTPVQYVQPPSVFSLNFEDISSLDETSRHQLVEKLAREDLEAPFDLATGPLFRIRLLRLGSSEYRLLFTMHHIICDAWSLTILMRELRQLYYCRSTNSQEGLRALSLQYADYAAWQRHLMAGQESDAHLEYWREALSGAETLELPTDYGRAGLLEERGDHIAFSWSESDTSKLKSLAQTENVTLFMLVLTLWFVVLSSYSGRQDLIVGTGLSTRTDPELEELIGFFVTALPLRARIGDGMLLADLIGQVRGTVLAAYDHAEFPFDQVIDEVPVSDRADLLRVMLVFQSAPRTELGALSTLLIAPALDVQPTARHDLSLHVWDEAGHVVGSLLYNTSLFRRSSATAIVELLERAIEAVVAYGSNITIDRILAPNIEESSTRLADFVENLNQP